MRSCLNTCCAANGKRSHAQRTFVSVMKPRFIYPVRNYFATASLQKCLGRICFNHPIYVLFVWLTNMNTILGYGMKISCCNYSPDLGRVLTCICREWNWWRSLTDKMYMPYRAHSLVRPLSSLASTTTAGRGRLEGGKTIGPPSANRL